MRLSFAVNLTQVPQPISALCRKPCAFIARLAVALFGAGSGRATARGKPEFGVFHGARSGAKETRPTGPSARPAAHSKRNVPRSWADQRLPALDRKRAPSAFLQSRNDAPGVGGVSAVIVARGPLCPRAPWRSERRRIRHFGSHASGNMRAFFRNECVAE